MQRGTASALTIIRVPRGAASPDETTIRSALAQDRSRLHIAANGYVGDYFLAGPHAVSLDGEEVDEYVVWET